MHNASLYYILFISTIIITFADDLINLKKTMTNKNEEMRLAMCESALALLNSNSMYTTKNALVKRMKQTFPMNDERRQRVYIKTAIQDLLDGGFVHEDGSLIKITDKGRESILQGGYTKAAERETNYKKAATKDRRLSLYVNIAALAVTAISETANLLITERNNLLLMAVSSAVCFIAGVLSSLLWSNLRRMQK